MRRHAVTASPKQGTGFIIKPGSQVEGEDESTRITLLFQRMEQEQAGDGAHGALDPKVPVGSAASEVPGIIEVGHGTFTPRAPQGLGVSSRRDGWFLAYVAAGRCDWFAREHIYELRPGSLCLVPPGVSYGGFDHVIQTCRCFWAVIDPVELAGRVTTAAELKSHLGQVRNVTFFGGLEIEPLFRRLVAAHQACGDLAGLQIRFCAMLLLTEAITAEADSVAAVRSKHEALPDLVVQATRLFSADIASIPTVTQVARECDVSRGHLHRLFTEHLGVSPKAYVQELRLRRARDLLKAGMPVREVARKVSLSAAGELRRLFMQALGCQPEQWLSRHAQLWESGNRLPGQAK